MLNSRKVRKKNRLSLSKTNARVERVNLTALMPYIVFSSLYPHCYQDTSINIKCFNFYCVTENEPSCHRNVIKSQTDKLYQLYAGKHQESLFNEIGTADSLYFSASKRQDSIEFILSGIIIYPNKGLDLLGSSCTKCPSFKTCTMV